MAEGWRHSLSADSWRTLPPRLYIALVGQLFGTPPSVNILEVLIVAAIGGLASWRSGDLVLAALTAATCMAILAIVPMRRHYANRRILEQGAEAVRAFELRFEWLSWGVTAGVGLMSARAILATGDTLVHLMMSLIALGAAWVSVRYHYRPRIAFGRIVGVNGMLGLALILSGNPYYLALGLVALAATRLSIDICAQLHNNAVTLLRTIDEKERLGELIETAKADLERRERERGAAEAALRRLQSEVGDAARLSAMGAMASTLAHELNQPLTAVANYVRGSRRLLERPTQTNLEEVAEALAAAEEGTLRAGEIIRRLRGLVYRGAADTRPEDLDLLIHESVRLALSDISPAQVTCRLDLAAEARWAYVDQVQIQQVLINLIRNAAEAMENAPVREIVIATRLLREDLIEVTVADTGPGIGDIADAVLFAPFHSTKAEGLGIGLAISRTIVEAHGGKIWANNGPAGGAVFRLTLTSAPPPTSGKDRDNRIARK